MSSRTYLSIGDVLTLLREEFPDVTISKIRFLESQGLVNPERSPSGYRKFFDHDVERLRWVLRQQREHFLPLKVIRDRLEDGELEEGEAEAANGGPGAHGAGPAAAESGAAQLVEEPTKADEEAMARILADASRRSAHLPAEAQTRRELQVVGEGRTAAATALSSGRAVNSTSGAEPAQTGAGTARTGASRRGGASGGGNGTPSGGTRRGKAGASTARTGSGPEPRQTKGSAGSGTATGAASSTTTGVSLTLEELCTASGLSPEEVAGLQSFGLIEPMRVAGIETFDEDALTVANLAVSFRSYGIEPRHLRLYRNAVDREVGLIEQVVIPLLRLRNPESRQRAVESADELASLGQSLRANLLRAALRRHLGG
ncbi:MAG TPA: MerR family transcriptional regulator [Acidimicrobiales bacterium]|nr:MerR family transcriptional regulator [Acidimicrobiales bacterium]